ncbi:unnamed protein product [Closterium sp. Yama58-4]|nr:unnamed protein product [Closterium sp. Yama58-4]
MARRRARINREGKDEGADDDKGVGDCKRGAEGDGEDEGENKGENEGEDEWEGEEGGCGVGEWDGKGEGEEGGCGVGEWDGEGEGGGEGEGEGEDGGEGGGEAEGAHRGAVRQAEGHRCAAGNTKSGGAVGVEHQAPHFRGSGNRGLAATTQLALQSKRAIAKRQSVDELVTWHVCMLAHEADRLDSALKKSQQDLADTQYDLFVQQKKIRKLLMKMEEQNVVLSEVTDKCA